MPKKTTSVQQFIDKYQQSEKKKYLKESEIQIVEDYISKNKDKVTEPELITLNFILYVYYKRKNDVDRFKESCENLIPLLENQKDYNRLGKVFLDYGVTNRIMGHYDESLESLNKAYDIFVKLDNAPRLAATLNSMANYYLEKGEVYLAFENYYKAFELIKDNTKIEVYHIVKHNLAHLYLILGYFDRAKLLYNQDLDDLKIDKNHERYASSLQGIAEVYLEQGKYGLAYKYAKMAVNEWEKTPNSRGIATSLATFGYTLSKFQRYDEAIRNFEKSKKILQKISYKLELSRLYFHLGTTYYDIENYEEARENLELSETYALEIKQNFELRKIYDKLYATYEKLDLHDKAYLTLQKLKDINDVFFNFNLQAKVNEVQISHELEKKELEYSKERELNEYKNNLFSYITHEFRTPLTLINTPLELIRNESDIYEIQSKIPKIVSHVHHMQELLNQLLDINKIDEGKMPINKKIGSVNSMVWNIVHIFETEMIDKNIDFKYNVPKKKIHGYFDTDKVSKIISNLISNALKYIETEDGEIILDVSVEDDNLVIKVKDNGIGIAKKYQKDIFSKFYRIPSQKDVKGSGLGLSFVHELVSLLNGNIKLSSKEGEGATFIVTLPFEKVDNVSEKIKEDSKKLKENSVDGDELNNLQTLLVVEDNSEIQKLVKEVFSDKYKVSLADHGREALEKIEKKVPDAIISDVMMPLMDGYELCRRIKNDENLNHIPVILLTAKSQSLDRLDGLDSGADAYITKPFNIDELRQTVDNILEQRKKIISKFSSNILNIHEEELVSADVVFIKSATEYVLNNLKNDTLSVTDLADHLNMSRFTLIRRFKNIQAVTPNNFIQKIRLEKAKEYLKARVANISEIAYMVGFSSTTYFSYSFKKEFGITPKQYYNSPD